MIKKAASIILVLALVAALCASVVSANTYNPNAEQELVDQQIAELLDQRKVLMFEDPINETAIANINAELESLGIDFLSDSEVLSQFPDAYAIQNSSAGSTVSPLADTPETSNVSWMNTRSTYTYNGQVYNVQKLIAEPMTESSSLWDEGVALINEDINFVAGATNFLNAVGTAALSYVNSKVMTFYDIFSSTWTGLQRTTVIDSVDAILSWESSTTAIFYYIRLASQTDEDQHLAFITTSCYLHLGYILDDASTYTNSNGDEVLVPAQVVGSVIYRATPSGYGNTAAAVQAHVSDPYRTTKDTVLNIYIYGPNDMYLFTISPCDPDFPRACG